MNLIDFLTRNRHEVLQLTAEHLLLVLIATAAAIAIGVPAGILLTRRPSLERPVLAVANVLQTIPSLALFGFLIPLLGRYGIGRLPAVIALFLYSLLPIIRNTFAGIRGVDRGVHEAALGMGLTSWQILTNVEIPLATGIIIAGIRVATVISVGTATIAAAIGAGGLGTYIFRGLRMNDNTLILAGAIPAALLALAADFGLGRLEKSLSPERAGSKSRVRRVTTIAATSLIIAGLAFFLGRELVPSWKASSRGGPARDDAPIVIGSKDFTEQVILGELLAQMIEVNTGLAVVRRFELGGDLCHRGLLAGEIDGYVEYTGTALMSILKEPPMTDPQKVFQSVKDEYAKRFQAEWLSALGFNNTFAILIRGEDAARLGIKTISEAARYTRQWRAGFGQDFMSREDGYAGFVRAYALQFAAPPREMDLSLTYRALASKQVDLIAGNSTDGLIEKLGLFQLEDNRHYFPPYEAAPVFRSDTLERHPEIRRVLGQLSGKVTEQDMRRMNSEADIDHQEVKMIVRGFIQKKGRWDLIRGNGQ
jgi:osmoprotectant transport system permease protein